MIKQGQDGDNLYVVEKGTLKCFRKSGNDQKYLKTYQPGESFGELALLYNAPRAASIQAETEAVLFALDRESFNHIVKDAAVKKRERYEEFLLKVKKLKEWEKEANRIGRLEGREGGRRGEGEGKGGGNGRMEAFRGRRMEE